MDEEMMCLECMWTGPEKDLLLEPVRECLNLKGVCPRCHTNHVDYVERIRRSSAKTKA